LHFIKKLKGRLMSYVSSAIASVSSALYKCIRMVGTKPV